MDYCFAVACLVGKDYLYWLPRLVGIRKTKQPSCFELDRHSQSESSVIHRQPTGSNNGVTLAKKSSPPTSNSIPRNQARPTVHSYFTTVQITCIDQFIPNIVNTHIFSHNLRRNDKVTPLQPLFTTKYWGFILGDGLSALCDTTALLKGITHSVTGSKLLDC